MSEIVRGFLASDSSNDEQPEQKVQAIDPKKFMFVHAGQQVPDRTHVSCWKETGGSQEEEEDDFEGGQRFPGNVSDDEDQPCCQGVPDEEEAQEGGKEGKEVHHIHKEVVEENAEEVEKRKKKTAKGRVAKPRKPRKPKVVKKSESSEAETEVSQLLGAFEKPPDGKRRLVALTYI